MIFISYHHAIVLHFCSGYFHRCVLLGDHLCFPFVWLFFVSFGKNVYSVNGCSAIALVMHLFVITIVFRLAFVIVYIYPVPVFFMFSGNQLHWSKRALAQYLLALRFFSYAKTDWPRVPALRETSGTPVVCLVQSNTDSLMVLRAVRLACSVVTWNRQVNRFHPTAR